MKQTELNLNWVCETTKALLDAVQVSIDGRELIAIVGLGAEADNWEATCSFLSSLDIDEETEYRAIERMFLARIERCLNLMRIKNLSLASPAPWLPANPVSALERENLAHAICYLVYLQLDRLRARSYQRDFPQLEFRWDQDLRVKRCLRHIERAEPHYHYFPGELVPLLANRLYQREIVGRTGGMQR
jgi:hypothetical protein